VGCTPIDNCASGNGGCDANATCTSTGPGTNNCACGNGYVGTGDTCVLATGVLDGIGQYGFRNEDWQNAGQNLERGTSFYVTTGGRAVGVTYYRTDPMTASRTGHLWSGDGELLGTVSFSETGPGWQRGYLTAPVTLVPNSYYVVSTDSPDGYIDVADGTFSRVPGQGRARRLSSRQCVPQRRLRGVGGPVSRGQRAGDVLLRERPDPAGRRVPHEQRRLRGERELRHQLRRARVHLQ
jgi:hypothetical protein